MYEKYFNEIMGEQELYTCDIKQELDSLHEEIINPLEEDISLQNNQEFFSQE